MGLSTHPHKTHSHNPFQSNPHNYGYHNELWMPCQMLLEFYDSLVPIIVFRFGLNHSPQIQVLNLLRNWKSWKEKQKKKKLRDGRIEQCILIWIISCHQHVSCHVHVYSIFYVSWNIFLLVKVCSDLWQYLMIHSTLGLTFKHFYFR